MLLAFFLFTPVSAVAPTDTFFDQSDNTVLIATKGVENKTAKTVIIGAGKEHIPNTTPVAYESLIREYAAEYGVSAEQMIGTINCETSGEWNPTMQSTYPNKRDGGRELSFGLAQIHLPDHPDVSLAQATDPDFSIQWMAEQFSYGRQGMWSCYRKLY